MAISFAIEFWFIRNGFNPRKLNTPSGTELQQQLEHAGVKGIPLEKIIEWENELVLTLKNLARPGPLHLSKQSYENLRRSVTRIINKRSPPPVPTGPLAKVVAALRSKKEPKTTTTANRNPNIMDRLSYFRAIVNRPDLVIMDQAQLFALRQLLTGRGPSMDLRVIETLSVQERKALARFATTAPRTSSAGIQDIDSAIANNLLRRQIPPANTRKTRPRRRRA